MNGLINNIDQPTNTNFLFSEQQQGDVNMFSSFKSVGVKGIIEENPISNMFFSKLNLDAIQSRIRYELFNKYKNVYDVSIIDKQSYDELWIVMRSIYLQFTKNDFSKDKIIEQILFLNDQVFEFCFEQVESQYLQYQGYLKKIKSLPIPMNRPQQVDKNDFTYDVSNIIGDDGKDWLSNKGLKNTWDSGRKFYNN